MLVSLPRGGLIAVEDKACQLTMFLDGSGKEIGSKRSSAMNMGFVGNMTVSWTCNLKKKVDSCDIVVTYWMDKKDVKVPFKQVLSLGF